MVYEQESNVIIMLTRTTEKFTDKVRVQPVNNGTCLCTVLVYNHSQSLIHIYTWSTSTVSSHFFSSLAVCKLLP